VQPRPAAAQAEQPLRAEEPAQPWLLLLGLAEVLQQDVRPLDLPAEPRRWLDAALWVLQPAEQPSLEDEPPRDRQAASQQ
jgi:hypothetical protein